MGIAGHLYKYAYFICYESGSVSKYTKYTKRRINQTYNKGAFSDKVIDFTGEPVVQC